MNMGIESGSNPAEEAAKQHEAKMQRQRTVDAKVEGIQNNPGEMRSKAEIQEQAEQEADREVNTEPILKLSDLGPEDLDRSGYELSEEGESRAKETLSRLRPVQLVEGMMVYEGHNNFLPNRNTAMFRLYAGEIKRRCGKDAHDQTEEIMTLLTDYETAVDYHNTARMDGPRHNTNRESFYRHKDKLYALDSKVRTARIALENAIRNFPQE